MKTPALLKIWLRNSHAYRLAYSRHRRRLVAEDHGRGLTMERFFWWYPQEKNLKQVRFRKLRSIKRMFQKVHKRT